MYAFTFQGKTFLPDGRIDVVTISDEYNRQQEAQELESLRAGVDRAFLYVRKITTSKDGLSYQWNVTTFLGTVVCRHAYVGDRQYTFGNRHVYRRPISACIFGRWYTGYYMESSGDYCRLKLAKHEQINYGPNDPIYGPWPQPSR